MKLKRAVVALGSNLGDPAGNLQLAISALAGITQGSVRASSLWRTAPVGFTGDVPDFCNAVAVIETGLTAESLLAALQQIEAQMGRIRVEAPTYESRIIDLDIVDFAGELMEAEGLVLPHPRAHERLFVLLPLREVLPDFRFPGREESLDDLIRQAPDHPVSQSNRPG